MKKLMIVTAIIEVHPRHSSGWVRNELGDKISEFAHVRHISVDDYQDVEARRGEETPRG